MAAHPPAEALVVGARAERLMRSTDASVAIFDTEGDAEELLLAYCEAAGVASAVRRAGSAAKALCIDGRPNRQLRTIHRDKVPLNTRLALIFPWRDPDLST